jgi:hypothetical protein
MSWATRMPTIPKRPGVGGIAARFLLVNGEASDFRLHEKFWQVIRRLKSSLSLEAFGVKVGVALDAPSDGLKTNNQLEVVEAGVATALRDLGCGAAHGGPLVLVDQVEGIWASDTDSDAMIIGLLMATKLLPHRFDGVRCVVFLRSDIYDLLEFSERDKLRGEEMRIDWTRPALLNLLLARAQASLHEPISPVDLWGACFPARLMAGRSMTICCTTRCCARGT